MEHCHELNPDNETDLFCLHYTFKELLSNEIRLFTESWNNHGVRTERNLTPIQLFVGGLHMPGNSCNIPTDHFPDIEVILVTELINVSKYILITVDVRCNEVR